MAETPKTDVKYNVNRDFASLLREHFKYIAKIFPKNVNNFREPQVARALLEVLDYNGVLLAYQQDRQYEQVILNENSTLTSLYREAYKHGWRLKGASSALCEDVEVSIIVDAKKSTGGKLLPDTDYLPKITNFVALGENGTFYTPLNNSELNFHELTLKENENYTPYEYNSSTGEVTKFKVTIKTDVVAGETKSESYTFSTYIPFVTWKLSSENIGEILSITDSLGNKWYEVDFLAQDFIFSSEYDVVNKTYELKRLRTSKRYICEYDPDTDLMTLRFGSGKADTDALIPDLAQRTLPVYGSDGTKELSINPQNFYDSDLLGENPYNVTLTVKYRIGSGIEGNLGSGQINQVVSGDMDFFISGLDATKSNAIRSSLIVYNPNKADGGRAKYTVAELLQLLPAFIRSQYRCVNKEDYITKLYTLPPKFGAIAKVSVSEDKTRDNLVNIYVLSEDANGYLTDCSTLIKRNISAYLRESYAIPYNLIDAQIINIGIDFSIMVDEQQIDSRSITLNAVIDYIKSYFDISGWQIGQKINKEELRSNIRQKVRGVTAVPDLFVKHLTGTSYTSVTIKGFNLDAYVTDKQVYCPTNCIFELKYPETDIRGRVIN